MHINSECLNDEPLYLMLSLNTECFVGLHTLKYVTKTNGKIAWTFYQSDVFFPFQKEVFCCFTVQIKLVFLLGVNYTSCSCIPGGKKKQTFLESLSTNILFLLTRVLFFCLLWNNISYLFVEETDHCYSVIASL